MMSKKIIEVGYDNVKKIKIGEYSPLVFIGGPCAIESKEHAFKMADMINKICKKVTISIFKSGSVIITGGYLQKQIDDAYIFINDLFKQHYHDIIKLSMIEIYKNICEKKINVRMLLQVHDELIFEIKEELVEESLDVIKSIMETTHLQYKDFIVPLTVEYGVGNDWGESH